jgi:hypothetical protein
MPTDPNLYHWTVIGEVIDTGVVRVWLTKPTADRLSCLVGSLDASRINEFILSQVDSITQIVEPNDVNRSAAAMVPLSISEDAYVALTETIKAVNDDRMFQLLMEYVG